MNAIAVWLILSAACGVLFQHPSAASGWKEFKSAESHFRVQYPSSWRRLSDNQKGLDIVNFPPGQGQHGIVLSPTGANIQVGGPPPWVRTLEEWIRANLQGTLPIEDGEIRITNPPPDGCTSFRRVVSRDDADGSGKHIFVDTEFYCSKGNRLYLVLLTNWEGDPKQAELQELALKIAQSLRTW
jgi:hypothetical protein